MKFIIESKSIMLKRFNDEQRLMRAAKRNAKRNNPITPPSWVGHAPLAKKQPPPLGAKHAPLVDKQPPPSGVNPSPPVNKQSPPAGANQTPVANTQPPPVVQPTRKVRQNFTDLLFFFLDNFALSRAPIFVFPKIVNVDNF